MDDSFWRVLYLIPVVMNISMLITFTLFIKQDSIMFNLSNGNDEEARTMIKKIYAKSEDS